MNRVKFERVQQFYSPNKIAALSEVLKENNIDTIHPLRDIGMTESQLYAGGTRTSVRQFIDLCRYAVGIDRLGDMAFRAGKKLHLSSYGPYGYALLSSLSSEELMQLAVKYHRLATPVIAIDWHKTEDCIIWEFNAQSEENINGDLRRFLLELQLSQHVTHFEDAFGLNCKPTLATFDYPEPDNASEYFRYLKCECRFNSPDTTLCYHADFQSRNPVQGSKIANTTLIQICDKLLADMMPIVSISGLIKNDALEKKVFFQSMESVAKELNMTSRTLRRRLMEENTTFSTLMDELRFELAKKHLIQTNLSLEEIGHLLGYSEYSGFKRAFHRRSGKSPAQFRSLEKTQK